MNTNKSQAEQLPQVAVMQSVLLPAELRIGNLTSAGIVVEIQKDCFYVHDGESSLKNTWFDIKPIPLTEEWLVKFGFKKTNESEDVEWYTLNNFDIAIHEEDNQVYFVFQHMVLRFIKSVHQLQNLHFALTQTELTVA